VKASLNGAPCEVPPGCASFGDLIFFVEQQRLPAGEVLTRIILDGEHIDAEQERELSARPCNELSQVEFHSARPGDFVLEGLSEATELLGGLVEELPLVAGMLRSGDIEDGLELFGPCLEVLSWYVRLLTAADAVISQHENEMNGGFDVPAGMDELRPVLDGDFVEEMPDLRSFASVENLRQKLIAIEEAQERDDNHELAGLVEFEILPIVQLWLDEVPQLMMRISHEGAVA
jgi:hypothetical protein